MTNAWIIDLDPIDVSLYVTKSHRRSWKVYCSELGLHKKGNTFHNAMLAMLEELKRLDIDATAEKSLGERGASV